jgi:MFS family permease
VRPLGGREFRLLCGGEAVSSAGDHLLTIALPFAVFRETGSPLRASIVLGLSAIPAVLLGPFAGWLVDATQARPLLVWLNVVNGAALVPCAFLSSTHQRVLYFSGLQLLQGVTAVMLIPARTVVLRRAVPDEQLPAANALASLADTAAALAVPMFGAAAYGAAGLRPILLGDLATFVLAAVLFARLTPLPPLERTAQPGSEFDIRAGFRLVAKTGFMRRLAGVGPVSSMAQGVMLGASIPFFTSLGLGPTGVGLVFLLQTVGSVAAGLFAGRLIDGWGELRSLKASLAIGGVILVAIAIVRLVPLTLILALFLGAPAAWIGIANATAMQRAVPLHMIGRVFGAVAPVAGVALAVGSLVGGLVAGSDPAAALTIAGVLYFVAALVSPRTRLRDRRA